MGAIAIVRNGISNPNMNDISTQAHGLARIIDRQPDGTFMLTISKNGRSEWTVQLVQVQEVKAWQLQPKKKPQN